eukprot:6479848-Amphidinium_carterae.2
MEVQWQGNTPSSDSYCHPVGVITTVQARCSSTTLRFKSMRRLTRPRSMMTSRVHQVSIQSEDNSEITYYSTWMRCDPKWRPWTSRASAYGDRSDQWIQTLRGKGKSQGPPVKVKDNENNT